MTHPLPYARFRAHTPARPTYRCRGCGAHWPCQPARLYLLHRYANTPDDLITLVAERLVDALTDRPRAEWPDVIDRFSRWLP